MGIRLDLTGTNGGGNGMAPTQRLTQPSKQQSPWAGQSVSLTPGLQQVLILPAHNDLGSGAVLAQP